MKCSSTASTSTSTMITGSEIIVMPELKISKPMQPLEPVGCGALLHEACWRVAQMKP